jgi:hypothetical protein
MKMALAEQPGACPVHRVGLDGTRTRCQMRNLPGALQAET